MSNLAQGLLTLGTMTGPLLIVVHLIPQGVLAGLFFVMGVQALEGNGITLKLVFLLSDHELVPRSNPWKGLNRLPYNGVVWLFTALELIGFGITFAITQTIAAIGFPIVILLLIPFRTIVMPHWFTPEELAVLDAPTASPFTMESVGGVHGDETPPVVGGPNDVTGPGTSGSSSSPIEEGDEAERGEAHGVKRGLGADLGKEGSRRRSFRGQEKEASGGIEMGDVKGKAQGMWSG